MGQPEKNSLPDSKLVEIRGAEAINTGREFRGVFSAYRNSIDRIDRRVTVDQQLDVSELTIERIDSR
jgi:hypothetical protein